MNTKYSKLRGASLFFAPHHNFAFLISNFSFLLQPDVPSSLAEDEEEEQ